MNSQDNSDSTQLNDDLSEALQLISRQLDGDLAVGEVVRLEELESQFFAETARFRSQCLSLRKNLKGLPQRAVSGMVFDTVSASVVDPSLRVNRRDRQFAVAMSSFVAVVCCCLLVMFLKSGDPLDGRDAVVASTDAAEDLAKTIPENSVVADLTEVELQPLLSSENWNVVVVRVDSKDRSQAMQQIESIANNHGLQLDKARGSDKADWLGVVLTSAVVDRDDVVNEMEQGLGRVSDGSDSPLIGDVDRRDVVNAVRKSFESPTQSELHHGRIFLALPVLDNSPGGSSEVPNQELLADAKASPQRTLAVPEAGEPSAKVMASSLAMPVLPAEEDSVTLVVFEFVSDGPNSNQKI